MGGSTTRQCDRAIHRRAATYGLTVAGAAAVPPLLELLADPAPLPWAVAQQRSNGLMGAELAVGGAVIKRPFSLNVLKDRAQRTCSKLLLSTFR